jgi:transcription antitermination protein NusB
MEGENVPTFHKRDQAAGPSVTTEIEGTSANFRLSPEGEQFLTSLLGIKDGDEVRAKDLALLVERGWAEREIEPEVVAEEPVSPPTVQPEPPPSPRRGEHRPVLIRRTRAREVALQVLYQFDQNGAVAPEDIDQFIRRRLADETLQRFAHLIVAGVRTHQARIDELISNAAENWRIDRMAAIDRNILRLGAFEMLFDPDVPVKVAINEALELAKRYSTAQSSRFVNGILDRLQGADPNAATPIVVEEAE